MKMLLNLMMMTDGMLRQIEAVVSSRPRMTEHVCLRVATGQIRVLIARVVVVAVAA